MTEILMWIGIVLVVIGWLALGWQASKRLVAKDQLEKFPQTRQQMQLRRNYCWLVIAAGVILLLIALIV